MSHQKIMVKTVTNNQLNIMAQIRKAKIKATGQIVEVYRLTSGGYGNYHDGGKTIYQESELEFVNE